MKINNSIFRYIEYELYRYEDTKKELENFRESIIEGTQSSEVAVQSGIGDTTASKAIKLTTSAYVLNTERIINAIDKSLSILKDRHRELFQLKYIEGLHQEEVYLEMNTSKRSYFRTRRELILAVAQQLGKIKL